MTKRMLDITYQASVLLKSQENIILKSFLFSFHNLIFISDNQLIKCERRIPNLPSIFILKIHILTSLESSNKNEGFERLEIPVFCSLLRIRPIVVRP